MNIRRRNSSAKNQGVRLIKRCRIINRIHPITGIEYIGVASNTAEEGIIARVALESIINRGARNCFIARCAGKTKSLHTEELIIVHHCAVGKPESIHRTVTEYMVWIKTIQTKGITTLSHLHNKGVLLCGTP